MATHALVKWVTKSDTLIDLVTTVCFENYDKKVGLIEESFYTVRYLQDKKKYKAQLLFLGNEEKCSEQLDILTQYYVEIEKNNKNTRKKTKDVEKQLSAASSTNVSDNPQSNSKKSNHSIGSNVHSVDKNQDQALQELQEQMKRLLSERDLIIKNKDLEISKIKAELTEIKSKYAEVDTNLDLVQPEKLLKLAKVIINLFGKEDDTGDVFILDTNNDNLMKSISSKYSHVKITMTNYENLMSLFKTDGIEGKKIVRSLINGVLTKPSDLTNTNAAEIRSKHPEIVSACLDFIQEQRPSFSWADMRRVITQMCSDSNAKIKKEKQKVEPVSKDSSTRNFECKTSISNKDDSFSVMINVDSLPKSMSLNQLNISKTEDGFPGF